MSYTNYVGTQEEAAEAYDIAAIKFRGLSAVTNFDMSRYNVKAILESPSLPIGSSAKRLKDANNPVPSMMISNNVSESANNVSGWQNAAFQHHQGMDLSLLQQQQERYVGYNYSGGNLSSESTRVSFKQEEEQQQHFLSNSIDHHSSTSDDSVTVCGNVVGYGGYQGFAIPVGTSVNCDAFTATEIAYSSRNHYYLAQQHQQQQIQQSTEGNFPVAISNNVGSNMYFHGEGGGEGASTFTVWNGT